MIPLRFVVGEQYVPPEGRHMYHIVQVSAVRPHPRHDVVTVTCRRCKISWAFGDFYRTRWEGR